MDTLAAVMYQVDVNRLKEYSPSVRCPQKSLAHIPGGQGVTGGWGGGAASTHTREFLKGNRDTQVSTRWHTIYDKEI